MQRLLLAAIVVGILGATAGSLFSALVDRCQELLFHEFPAALGLSSTPWWWSTVLLLISPVIVMLARRLPGATGKGPLTGFHFDNPLVMVPSILIAAFGTLAFGMVLGPEAPLIVAGTAVGAILTRKSELTTQKAVMLLGGMAAIGSVFGNPFITGFMLLEFAAFGVVPSLLVLPGFLALGAGYLTQIGINGIPGLGTHSLAVDGLPTYNTIRFGDLAMGIVVALVASLVALIVRTGAVRIDALSSRRATPVLFGAAIATAIVFIIANAGFGIDPVLILFNGAAGMTPLIQQTAIGTVIVILLAKAIAYMVALGGGYRGGPIFPATFLGVAVAMVATLLLTDIPVTPLAAAGIAATSAAMIKLPATSALLGMLLIAGAGAAVAPFAILGAVIGVLIRMVHDNRTGNTAPAQSPETPNTAPA